MTDGWGEWTSATEWDTGKDDVQFECIGGIHRVRTRARSLHTQAQEGDEMSKPQMTLPNGDVIDEGDYAVTHDGQKVGPMIYGHNGSYRETHPWIDGYKGMTFASNGSWDDKVVPCLNDIIAKWHPVEAGPDPVTPAKRRKWWIANGQVFKTAREAKTAFPICDPIKVKECKV